MKTQSAIEAAISRGISDFEQQSNQKKLYPPDDSGERGERITRAPNAPYQNNRPSKGAARLAGRLSLIVAPALNPTNLPPFKWAQCMIKKQANQTRKVGPDTAVDGTKPPVCLSLGIPRPIIRVRLSDD